MESVELMNLKRILRNRKAMTPLMIGIIIASSVIAVTLIVFTATVQYFPKETQLFVNEQSIRGNSTDSESLIFKVTCDYAPATITNVLIRHDDTFNPGTFTDYGTRAVIIPLDAREVLFTEIRYFTAVGGAPVQNGTHLLFEDGDEYELIITYENADGVEFVMDTILFTYNALD
jgi:hypothetical protein